MDDFLTAITDDDYRHHLQDLFDALAGMDGLTVFWGTTGCSLRVAVPNRSPLSIGWVFPPGPPRWMGLTDLTLGWYEDSSWFEIIAAGNRHKVTAEPVRSHIRPALAKVKPGVKVTVEHVLASTLLD